MSSVKCLRCGEEKTAISEKPPYPGAIGEKIAQNICQTCWEAWRKFSVNVINDHKLRPYLPQDRAIVEKNMKQFLNLEPQEIGSAPVAMTLTGQGNDALKEKVVTMLENIFDPEVPVNIYDLGLIYDIAIKGDEVAIRMSLTSKHCPAAQSLPATVKEAVERIPGVKKAMVDVVWDPPWTRERVSEEGRKILGF